MPSGPVALFVPVMIPMTDQAGNVREEWRQFFQLASTQLQSNAVTLNGIPGVNVKTLATQPSLGVGDAGYLLWLTDYKHLLRWTGATWEFFGEEGNAFFKDFAIIPQTGLWQLCDGTVVNYLTLGATLTETAFTTPNLTATPAYRKSAAAYTGAINAKAGSTGTGTTGTGTTGTDITGDESAHTHQSAAFDTAVQAGGPGLNVGGTTQAIHVAESALTTSAGTAHHHSVPGLSVPGLSVPALGVGSIEMANLGCLPYFRR